MNTQEVNQILAEFMGFVFVDNFPSENKKIYVSMDHPMYCEANGQTNMWFHEDWSWLMPAWNHFRFLCWKTIGYTKEFDEWTENFLRDVFNGSCESAAKTLACAVKWLNQGEGSQRSVATENQSR